MWLEVGGIASENVDGEKTYSVTADQIILGCKKRFVGLDMSALY
jgi:hypothetical protein